MAKKKSDQKKKTINKKKTITTSSKTASKPSATRQSDEEINAYSSADLSTEPARESSKTTSAQRDVSNKPKQRQPERKPGGRKQCVVVGIGASAGGLDAYKQLLRNFPHDSGLAFVFVQHLDPTHESLMVELLSKHTAMPVLQIENATPIQPNHVYMIPPNSFVKIKDNGLYLDKPITRRGVKLPIDYFFRSLAEARQERAICVVMSGTGSDGAEGIRHVKNEGGMTIAQNPDTAEYDGMPRSALGTGSVDYVVPIDEMASVILPYARHPYVKSSNTSLVADKAPDHFRAIIALLRAHTDHDFSRYKKGTVARRIDRRMGIRHVSKPEEYLQLLRSDREELQNLFKDLLIGVTAFFRDTDAWEDLAKVLTKVILEKSEDDILRIWVPGCATGEEAYSVAMLINELQLQHNRRLELQVFATDIDSDSIETARAGLYPEHLVKDLSDQRIESFFQREGNQLQVRKKIRESCIFAAQNLLSDPPFSNIDLVCCRNLLIYLESDVQVRIFEMLHFALRPNGYLFLGTSESPSKRKGLFEPVSQSARIYQKIGKSSGSGSGFPIGKRNNRVDDDQESPPQATGTAPAELSKRALLERFAPASVVVNQRGVIQYIHGNVGNYLSLPSGEPQWDVCEMAVEGLKSKTRSCLQQARSENELVTAVAPRVRRDGKFVRVQIHVQPLPSGSHGPSYLISFLDDFPSPDSTALANPSTPTDRSSSDAESHEQYPEDQYSSQQLALELQATREDLQSTIEELESSNEELKASNEEVMSMNEELQSTNEELETSREELQSLNEELSTVNNQLHDKVDELEATTNDLTNLLSSTDMATIFLGVDLRIRRFTPATMRLMNMLDSDIGRPLLDLAPRVQDPELASDAQHVLDKLTPVEREVQTRDQQYFLRRITPFRTSDNRIDGVVVTFSDVTAMKLAGKRVELRERQQAVVAELGRVALGGTSLDSLLNLAAEKVADTLQVELTKILRLKEDRSKLKLVAGVGWDDGLVGKAIVPSGINSQAGYTLHTAGPVIVENLNQEKRFGGPQLLRDHKVISGMSVLIGPEESPWGVLGVHTRHLTEFTVDDTHFIQAVANVLWEACQRRRSEKAMRDRERRLTLVTDAMPALVAHCDRNLTYLFCNKQYLQWFGLKQEQIIGKTVPEIVGQEAFQTLRPSVERVLSGEHVTVEQSLRYRHGPRRYVRIRYVPDHDSEGQVAGYYAMISDISRQEKADRMQAQLAAIVADSNDAIIAKDLNGVVTSWNRAAETLYGYSAAEMIGESIARIVPDDRLDELASILERLSRDKAIQNFETVRRCKDGSLRDVNLCISPIHNSEGKVVGASAIARDVTEDKRIAQELEMARQAAEAANEAKSTFLANMSHEIRTPMTAILGYADLLAATLEDDDALACVRTIVQNGAYLCELINDILDLSRIEAGKITLRRESCSIIEILADIRSLMTVRATEKSLTLSLEFESEIPVEIQTDKKLVRQVLVNLVGNAIKFTQKGSIKIVLRCLAKEQKLEIRVIDTGVGITDKDVETLFQPFEQLDNSLTRTAGGSGLGLAISQKLVEMLGGQLTVESKPGEGSCFCFQIDTGSLENAAWRFPKPDDLRKFQNLETPERLPRLTAHVVAADDRRDIRFLVARFIETAGGTVESAENGQQCVDLVLSRSEDDPAVDLVLMDMQMPLLDGVEATKRLRAHGYKGPIIALTANAMQKDQQRCLEAGCDDFVSKPIDKKTLLEKIANWTSDRHDAPQLADSDKLGILLLNPDFQHAEQQELALQQKGHRTSTITDPSEAIEKIADFKPDSLLIRWSSDNESLADLIAQWKTHPSMSQCPIVCLFNSDNQIPMEPPMGCDGCLAADATAEQIEHLLTRLRLKYV